MHDLSCGHIAFIVDRINNCFVSFYRMGYFVDDSEKYGLNGINNSFSPKPSHKLYHVCNDDKLFYLPACRTDLPIVMAVGRAIMQLNRITSDIEKIFNAYEASLKQQAL